jgi:hypothetical protein
MPHTERKPEDEQPLEELPPEEIEELDKEAVDPTHEKEPDSLKESK